MSTLDEYLKRSRLRQADFAAAVGASQGTISKLVSGQVRPSLALAMRIERATKGDVPVGAWLEVGRALNTPDEDAA